MTIFLLVAVVAYFVGAIPFGVLIAKRKGIDILNYESGNPGATNVGRALGRTAGLFVFALDVLKGLMPTLAARFLVTARVGPFDPQLLWAVVGICAVIGHSFSPFLNFKGGKGVSTSLGMTIGVTPLPALSGLIAFGLTAGLSRYVSLGSIVAMGVALTTTMLYPGNSPQLIPLFTSLFLFVVYLHRANIRRIISGTERKIGQKDANDVAR